MLYSQEALEDMSEKINLLDYASKTVDFVKHSGDTYFAICPFHHEKTPSLAVNTGNNFFHCFGCGRSGNIYTWLQLTESLSFDQAVKKVADITGTNVTEYVESESMAFYKLLNRLSKARRAEVVERPILNIDRDYRQRFKDDIPQEWVDEGITPEELKKYEVMIDPTSNRIVYPVYDADYQLIGIKGRTRFKNYKELRIMKYMNYNKIGIMDFFTGMKQADEFIKEKNQIIIVEGIKSVMKLDEWGYHNVVSAETSCLNEYQIELLIRMQVRDVIIAFDKDVEMKKIKESIRLLKRFINIYVVHDRWGLLGEKDSPCDKGQETFQILYERRVRM